MKWTAWTIPYTGYEMNFLQCSSLLLWNELPELELWDSAGIKVSKNAFQSHHFTAGSTCINTHIMLPVLLYSYVYFLCVLLYSFVYFLCVLLYIPVFILSVFFCIFLYLFSLCSSIFLCLFYLCYSIFLFIFSVF